MHWEEQKQRGIGNTIQQREQVKYEPDEGWKLVYTGHCNIQLGGESQLETRAREVREGRSGKRQVKKTDVWLVGPRKGPPVDGCQLGSECDATQHTKESIPNTYYQLLISKTLSEVGPEASKFVAPSGSELSFQLVARRACRLQGVYVKRHVRPWGPDSGGSCSIYSDEWHCLIQLCNTISLRLTIHPSRSPATVHEYVPNDTPFWKAKYS